MSRTVEFAGSVSKTSNRVGRPWASGGVYEICEIRSSVYNKKSENIEKREMSEGWLIRVRLHDKGIYNTGTERKSRKWSQTYCEYFYFHCLPRAWLCAVRIAQATASSPSRLLGHREVDCSGFVRWAFPVIALHLSTSEQLWSWLVEGQVVLVLCRLEVKIILWMKKTRDNLAHDTRRIALAATKAPRSEACRLWIEIHQTNEWSLLCVSRPNSAKHTHHRPSWTLRRHRV